MTKRKKRLVKTIDCNKENITDTISNDMKKSGFVNLEPQLTTPSSTTRLSCYETPKLSSLSCRNLRDNRNMLKSPISNNVNLLFSYENIDSMENVLNKKSINSPSVFYTCYDKQLDSDQRYKPVLGKRKGISSNNETPKCTRKRQRQKSSVDISPSIRNPLIRNDTYKLLPSYLKNQETNKKEGNNGDPSFSPDVFHSLFSSTPLVQPRKIFGNIEEGGSVGEKDNNNVISSNVPTFNQNLHLNKSYTQEKTVNVGQDIADSFQVACNQCKQYEKNNLNLSKRVEEFMTSQNESLQRFNRQLNQVQQNMSIMQDLIQSEFQALKEQIKMNRMQDFFQSEFEILKEQIKMITTISVPSSLPPPPPPPLPPPPVLPLLESKISLNLQKKSSGRNESGANQILRPSITREDILKVKLKKISARPYKPNQISQRNNKPLDMLNTVSSTPTSRNPHLHTAPENESMDVTLSPNTRLCTLLKNEISSTKIKRLQRIGRFSCKSVYERKLAEARDRE